MATHSSLLAWRIPWTEEPRGLHPLDCKKLDRAEEPEHAHMCWFLFLCYLHPLLFLEQPSAHTWIHVRFSDTLKSEPG